MSDRFDRLRSTATLGSGAFERWQEAVILVSGCGNLGTRFAREAVRSGARVVLCDDDRGELHNLAVQEGIRVGAPKSVALAEACERIVPGRARAIVGDVRHVGLRTLLEADLIVDATDDPATTPYLTQVSNGLARPLLRLAIDGSGERELGRVLVSHGGDDGDERPHACALCSWTRNEVLDTRVVTPCPGHAAPARPPTLAGGAIGMTVAGLGLLQAQRLLGGNGRGLALDHELRIDLDAYALLSIELERVEDCPSGHEGWSWTEIPGSEDTPLARVFELVRDALGAAADVWLEPVGHVLRVGADCVCGVPSNAVGTRFVEPAPCACGHPTEWHPAVHLQHIDVASAREHDLLERTVVELGLPSDGALFLAHGAGPAPGRFLLTPPDSARDETAPCPARKTTRPGPRPPAAAPAAG